MIKEILKQPPHGHVDMSLELKAVVLVLLVAVLTGVYSVEYITKREDEEGSSTSGSGDDDDSSQPILSPDAIANITGTAAGILVLSSAVCYLLMCFNKQERMQRVRAAQERNRQITRQIETVKQKKRAQQRQTQAAAAAPRNEDDESTETSNEEERRSAGSLLFSQVHRSHHEDQGEASRDHDHTRTLAAGGSKHQQT